MDLGNMLVPIRPISNSAERSIYVRASLSTGLQSHCACREPSGDFLSRARPTIHCIVGTFTVLSVVEIRCFSFATLEPLAPQPPPPAAGTQQLCCCLASPCRFDPLPCIRLCHGVMCLLRNSPYICVGVSNLSL